MRTDKSVVTARKVTRYYIYGRGYSSELAAYMQLAKEYVRKLSSQAFRSSGLDWRQAHEFDRAWYQARYPYREGCPCSYCSTVKYAGSAKHFGCWLAKMEDYRQIAREIMAGKRNNDGSLPLALPERCEVPA